MDNDNDFLFKKLQFLSLDPALKRHRFLSTAYGMQAHYYHAMTVAETIDTVDVLSRILGEYSIVVNLVQPIVLNFLLVSLSQKISFISYLEILKLLPRESQQICFGVHVPYTGWLLMCICPTR